MNNTSTMDVDEDSRDVPSVDPDFQVPTSTPVAAKKFKRGGNKNVTAYIVFAAEIRKAMVNENHGLSFGEISQLVGSKWRNLSDAEKLPYEDKARKMNKIKDAERAIEEKKQEELRRIDEQNAALKEAAEEEGGDSADMPDGRISLPSSGPWSMNNIWPAPQRIFRPPRGPTAGYMERPTRLLHSENYVRYVEYLTADPNNMNSWEHQLEASKELVKCPNEAQLSSHWLPNNAINAEHGTSNSHDAQWALRDFLMCDSPEVIGISRVVQGPL